MDMREITRRISESVFCYENKPKQGFRNKSECKCYLEQKRCCEAFFEQERFHMLYDEYSKKGYTRSQIIEEIKKEFVWEETSWIQYNVLP